MLLSVTLFTSINAFQTLSHIDEMLLITENLPKNKEDFERYILMQFEAMGIEKVETDLGVIKTQKCPLSVEINEEDEDKIPKEYKKEKITYSIDKESIKKLYKEKGIKLANVRYVVDKKKIKIS